MTPSVTIPLHEFEVRASRSGGPGGQHVNKVETQIEVRWDLDASAALSPHQKARVRERLGSRLTRGHLLRVRSRAQRSQAANRRVALERLAELLADALRPRKSRRKTRPTAASREARLGAKRRQGEKKRDRRRPVRDD